MKLFRIKAKSGIWCPKRFKGIYYVVATDEKEALEYVKKYAKNGVIVSDKVSCLGEQYSGIMFGKITEAK